MIFGIAGKLESGKDTVSDYLVKEFSFVKLAFADNLKQMCMKVFGLTHDQCYTTEGKFEELEKPVVFTEDHAVQIMNWLIEKNHWDITPSIKASIKEVVRQGIVFETPRFILQFIGTEVMRDCVDADIHAKIVFRKIKRENIKKVVISDARFANERRITREEGGRMILVDCVQTREQESTHRSETGLGDESDYDHVIINDKTKGFDELWTNINNMMGEHENSI